jgi:hypothetical protein
MIIIIVTAVETPNLTRNFTLKAAVYQQAAGLSVILPVLRYQYEIPQILNNLIPTYLHIHPSIHPFIYGSPALCWTLVAFQFLDFSQSVGLLGRGISPSQKPLPAHKGEYKHRIKAVSRWLPTAAARVRARIWSCGICGGQSGAGAGFLRVLRCPLPIFIPQIAPQLPSSIIWGLHNRPEVAAVPSGLSPTPLIKNRINAHRHPCLKWDSNPRSQCLRWRRQFIPQTERPL